VEREKIKKRNKKGGTHYWRGGWRPSRNGGLKGEFEGVCKMEVRLEALLELYFCTKPLNFGVETHIKTLAGDALGRAGSAIRVPHVGV
jgi:hypothetical protein